MVADFSGYGLAFPGNALQLFLAYAPEILHRDSP